MTTLRAATREEMALSRPLRRIVSSRISELGPDHAEDVPVQWNAQLEEIFRSRVADSRARGLLDGTVAYWGQDLIRDVELAESLRWVPDTTEIGAE